MDIPWFQDTRAGVASVGREGGGVCLFAWGMKSVASSLYDSWKDPFCIMRSSQSFFSFLFIYMRHTLFYYIFPAAAPHRDISRLLEVNLSFSHTNTLPCAHVHNKKVALVVSAAWMVGGRRGRDTFFDNDVLCHAMPHRTLSPDSDLPQRKRRITQNKYTHWMTTLFLKISQGAFHACSPLATQLNHSQRSHNRLSVLLKWVAIN